MEAKRICPFCKGPVTSKHYWRYDDWSCGCQNEDCLIRPMTSCKSTKELAEQEWDNAFRRKKR